MSGASSSHDGRQGRSAALGGRDGASRERWIAVFRLGVVPFLLVQLALAPPANAPAMLLVAAFLALSGAVVLSLYARRPELLDRAWVQIAIFTVDCLAFTLALADRAGPGDLTWLTFIFLLFSATLRWDVRGAVASVIVFAVADLPLDIGTPSWTHLRFDPGATAFKLGLVALLAFLFATQFRSLRRVSRAHQAQADALRRQAETLIRSESQLRVIFDSALIGLITIDEDGTVRDWNRYAEAMFGWTRGEVVGRRLSETILPLQHRREHEAALAAYRTTRSGAAHGKVIEITAIHRAGREFPIELSISPASSIDGRTTFIAFLRDISDRKRSESLHAIQVGITRALSEARSLEEAAPQILEELGTRLDLVLAQWWAVEPRAEELTWKDAWSAPGLSAVDFIHDSQQRAFVPERGLPGRTWSAGQVSVIEDVQVDPGFARHQQARAAGLRAAVAFPILNGPEVTGVVELFSTAPGSFNDDVVRVLASIGGQVGQFLERRRAEEALQFAGQRINAVLENVADGIITVDDHDRLQSLNASARRLFGYLPDEVVGGSIEVLVEEGDRDRFMGRRTGPASGRPGTAGVLECLGRRLDGSTFPMEVRTSEMSVAGQQVKIISLRDISERRAQTEALQYQALHDGLTGLPNRTLLGDRLRQAVAVAARDHKPLALLLLDLDGFKEVNDTMGHPHGDLILQQVAWRIRELLREADTVARLGGDEFAILPTGATAREGAIRTAQKVVKAFQSPFIIDDRAFDIRASIGIALFPEHGEDAESLMRRTDVAMYVAKRGKKPYEIYEASQDADTALRLALMSELRHAADREELLLHYLPKIDLRTGKVVAVEALLRWAHPDRGTLTPDQFVPFAEQTEIINSVNRWVLDAALHQLRDWLDAGIELAVAVNMSARNLHDPELSNVVARLLTTWKVPGELLIVEITEAIAMDASAEERLKELGALGVRLSIDDFGTGYSSLAYLKRLPMEELKIDRSFVASMDTNPDDAAIVRPTIDLGHNLGLRVVAEGVESEAALDMLRAYGCDLAQGHFISPPLEAAALTVWLKDYEMGDARPSRQPSLRAIEGTPA